MKTSYLFAFGIALIVCFTPNLRALSVEEKLVVAHPVQQVNKEIRALTKKATSGDAKAQFKLAEMYETGRGGLEKNMSYAVSWYEEAAMSGHKQARAKLRALGSVN